MNPLRASHAAVPSPGFLEGMLTKASKTASDTRKAGSCLQQPPSPQDSDIGDSDVVSVLSTTSNVVRARRSLNCQGGQGECLLRFDKCTLS